MKLLAIAVCTLIIGCAKAPPAIPRGPEPEIVNSKVEIATAAPDSNAELPWTDLEWQFQAPAWTLYFDFNSSQVTDTGMAASLAKYLRDNPGDMVALAGHTSEEGAEDYNLALGSRRALSVQEYLVAAGVRPERITWKSFGEEVPFTNDPGQFNLNRRVEITLEESK